MCDISRPLLNPQRVQMSSLSDTSSFIPTNTSLHSARIITPGGGDQTSKWHNTPSYQHGSQSMLPIYPELKHCAPGSEVTRQNFSSRTPSLLSLPGLDGSFRRFPMPNDQEERPGPTTPQYLGMTNINPLPQGHLVPANNIGDLVRAKLDRMNLSRLSERTEEPVYARARRHRSRASSSASNRSMSRRRSHSRERTRRRSTSLPRRSRSRSRRPRQRSRSLPRDGRRTGEDKQATRRRSRSRSINNDVTMGYPPPPPPLPPQPKALTERGRRPKSKTRATTPTIAHQLVHGDGRPSGTKRTPPPRPPPPRL